MKKKLVPFAFLLVCFFTLGCAEEVIPASEDFQEATEYTVDDLKSTDGEDDDPGILPPKSKTD